MTEPVVYKAPDGGWGWVIVFASFLLQALSVGITYTFGIIYVDLLDYFKDTESNTAWIGSFQPALLYSVCVLTGPLLIKFGWRFVVMCGTCLSSVGFFLSYLAPNVYVLYVTYGFLTGSGYGLLYMVSMVIVQHYFDRRRSLATGLAVSGSGMGTVGFGILIGQLLQYDHWKTAVLVEGLITMAVGSLCTYLIRPPPEEKREEESDPLIADNSSPSASQYGSVEHQHSEESTTSSSPRHEELFSDPEQPSTPEKQSGVLAHEGNDFDKPVISRIHFSARRSNKTVLPTIADQDEEIGTSRGSCCNCTSCLKQFDDKFRFSLCSQPIMIVYCLAVMCFCFGYHVPYTFTTDRAKVMFKIHPTKSSLLISIMGIANVSSRLIFGWVGDNSATLRLWMLGSVIGLCGVLNTLIFLFTNFTLLVVYSVFFGILSGCFASLIPVVLVDQMGLEVIEFTLGQVLATSSIAFLLASPISGLIIEKTGSYDLPFIGVGIAQIFGGFVFFTIPLIRRICPQRCHQVVTYDEKSIIRKRRMSKLFEESIA